MIYREGRLNYSHSFELAGERLIVRSRTWPSLKSERTFSLASLDPNVGRQWQRDQWLKGLVVLISIIGICVVVIWAVLRVEAVTSCPAWLMPLLIGLFLLIGLASFILPFKEEYAIFRTTAGVFAFAIRKQGSGDFEAFISELARAIEAARPRGA